MVTLNFIEAVSHFAVNFAARHRYTDISIQSVKSFGSVLPRSGSTITAVRLHELFLSSPIKTGLRADDIKTKEITNGRL